MVLLFVFCSFLQRDPHQPLITMTKKNLMKIFLGLTLFTMGYIISITQKWSVEQLFMRKDWAMDTCFPNLSTDPFIPIQGSKTFVLNAFFEHRTHNMSLRLISIVWRPEKTIHHCLLCCQDRLFTSLAKRTIHNSHFGFPYGTGDFLCDIPEDCEPTHAGLVSEDFDPEHVTFVPILNRVPRESSFPVNFTVCLSTMFGGYNNVLQFVQAMEMYRLLGAQRVVVYKTNCSRDMEEVLHYYKDEVGLVEVFPWPIDTHIKVSSSWLATKSPGDLHYYGQIPALNDCLYRNMYQTKYLLLHDPDEIILPVDNNTWGELLSTLEIKYGNKANFYFENNVFPIEKTDESSRFNLSEWATIPGINFLLHVLREPILKSHYKTGKLIINPRTVFEISVHGVKRQNSRTVEVSSHLGRLYHIRRRKNGKLKSRDFVRDEGLLRFAPQMIRKVVHSLRKMNLPSQKQ